MMTDNTKDLEDNMEAEEVKTEVKEEEVVDVKEEPEEPDQLGDCLKYDFEYEDSEEDSYEDEDDDEEEDYDEDDEPVIDLGEHGNQILSSGNASNLQDPLDLEIDSSGWDQDQVNYKEDQPLPSLPCGRIHPQSGLTKFRSKLEVSTIHSIEYHVRQFIEGCVTSKEDPKCKQEFYFTVHHLLVKAMEQNIISSVKQADKYWRKFDGWASKAFLRVAPYYRHGDVLLANDPKRKPRLPRESNKTAYKYKPVQSRLQTTVYNFIMLARKHKRPLRDDLQTRVKFYEIFRRYVFKQHASFMDFFWNILLNREAKFYRLHSQHIPILEHPQKQQKVEKSTEPTKQPITKTCDATTKKAKFVIKGASTRSGRKYKVKLPFDSIADEVLRKKEITARYKRVKRSVNKKYGTKTKISKATTTNTNIPPISATATTATNQPEAGTSQRSNAAAHALQEKLRPYLQLNNEGWILNLDSCGGDIIPSIWWQDPENKAKCENR